MARYRLRFLLQEIDLPQGDTVIGRSPNCQVTLQDPLVSRRHACVRIDGEQVTIEDLGSRNGLRVGGLPVQGTRILSDGDRIRIGTQELVFCELRASEHPVRGARATGFMCHCAACGMPHPAELGSCPSCGSTERSDDDTLSGVGHRELSWTLELLCEVLKKAGELSRWEDVQRVLERARTNVEQQVAEGYGVPPGQLEIVAQAAVDLSLAKADASWGRWMLTIYASLGWVPPAATVDPLFALPERQRDTLAEGAERVLRASTESTEGQDGEARRRLRTLLEAVGQSQ